MTEFAFVAVACADLMARWPWSWPIVANAIAAALGRRADPPGFQFVAGHLSDGLRGSDWLAVPFAVALLDALPPSSGSDDGDCGADNCHSFWRWNRPALFQLNAIRLSTKLTR